MRGVNEEGRAPESALLTDRPVPLPTSLFVYPLLVVLPRVSHLALVGTGRSMMGEHGFLSHSLLALGRGRAQRDGATLPAGSSTATEQCDLTAVEIEAAPTRHAFSADLACATLAFAFAYTSASLVATRAARAASDSSAVAGSWRFRLRLRSSAEASRAWWSGLARGRSVTLRRMSGVWCRSGRSTALRTRRATKRRPMRSRGLGSLSCRWPSRRTPHPHPRPHPHP